MKGKINRIIKSPFFEHFLLSFIIILAFLVRLYKLQNPIADWHSWRQADTASVSRIYIQEGINLLIPRYHDLSSAQTGQFNPRGYRMVEFPLYNGIQASLVNFSNNYLSQIKSFPLFSLEIWGRLVTITASLISTVFVYLIAKKQVSQKAGLLAAFFFAFLPFNIYYSRTILPDPLAIAFGLGAIYFFQTIPFLSAILFSISILIKPFTVFWAIPLIYLALKEEMETRNRKKIDLELVKGLFRRKKYWLYGLIVLIPFIGWRVWISQFPEGIAHWRWMFNSDRILGKPSFFKWIFGERIGYLILGAWGLIPFGYGLIKMNKKNLFLEMFLLSGLLYLGVFATANVRHDYYQLFLIPAISLTLARGASEMKKETKTKILLGISLFLLWITAGYEIKDYYQINHPEIIEAGKVADQLTPKDALIIAPYNKDTAFLYQTNHKGWPFIDGSIEEMIERGAQYYITLDPNDSNIQKYKVIKETDNYFLLDLSRGE